MTDLEDCKMDLDFWDCLEVKSLLKKLSIAVLRLIYMGGGGDRPHTVALQWLEH